jgi:hypothetical protein
VYFDVFIILLKITLARRTQSVDTPDNDRLRNVRRSIRLKRAEQRTPFTVRLPPSLAEKIRDIAHQDELSLDSLGEMAFRNLVKTLERKRGDAYLPRTGGLKRGRARKRDNI